jgi:hypothetical protein
MPFIITFQPINRIQGVGPKSTQEASAVAAWKTVDGLMRSDETVEITHPDGYKISWQELKALADGENK